VNLRKDHYRKTKTLPGSQPPRSGVSLSVCSQEQGAGPHYHHVQQRW